MPPFSLISFTASFTPSLKLVPEVAPVPESSTSPKIFIACASAGCANAIPSASEAAARLIHIVMVPFRWKSFRSLCDDIGLEHGAQLRRHLRIAAEPFAKAEAGLMQQHAETVDRAVAALARRGDERRLERYVDHVVHHGAAFQRREIELERLLARHAERRAIHQHIGRRE